MMIAKEKIQKPIEYDISFKYICQNCGYSHWLFLREVQTKGFKVVCDCLEIFQPANISGIDIVYENEQEKQSELKAELSVSTIESCAKSLATLGYEIDECKEMIIKSFEAIGTDDAKAIIEYSLNNFGGQYV